MSGEVRAPVGVPAPQPGGPRSALKLTRWFALLGLLSTALSVALLWWQHRIGVVHPVAFLFAPLFAISILTALVGTTSGLWRFVRGPSRGVAAAWVLACLVPLGLWTGLAAFTLQAVASEQAFPKNVVTDLIGVALASLMEDQARLVYPHRLESQRLVMFFDDRVSNPQRDLETMDQHVAALEAATGKPLRAKIYWVRGEIFGRGRTAIRGLVLGSSQSPDNWDTADHPFHLSVDRHELAHGVMHQMQPMDTDAPTLLIEGWAELHSGMTTRKRAELAKESHDLWSERNPNQSYLRELTGPAWYRRVAGPVYSVGGAFAEFVVRKYGIERFLGLYFASRPGRFEEECRKRLGVEFGELESAFWAEVERLAVVDP